MRCPRGVGSPWLGAGVASTPGGSFGHRSSTSFACSRRWLLITCDVGPSHTHSMQSPRYIPSLHVVALLTAAATFPLIFMGGLVTSHQAGMSVPDWPNSYGYNMFLFPPRLWIGGILFEHTHRLMGTVVGMLSICLIVAAYRSRWAGRRERM